MTHFFNTATNRWKKITPGTVLKHGSRIRLNNNLEAEITSATMVIPAKEKTPRKPPEFLILLEQQISGEDQPHEKLYKISVTDNPQRRAVFASTQLKYRTKHNTPVVIAIQCKLPEIANPTKLKSAIKTHLYGYQNTRLYGQYNRDWFILQQAQVDKLREIFKQIESANEQQYITLINKLFTSQID